MTTYNTRVTWSDATGTRVTGYYDSVGDLVIGQSVANCSTALAVLTRVTNQGPFLGPGPYIPGLYDLSYVAELLFKDANGLTLRVNVPAPATAIFRPGGIVVDPTNTHVAQLIADVLALGASNQGASILTYQQGRRVAVSLPPVPTR